MTTAPMHPPLHSPLHPALHPPPPPGPVSIVIKALNEQAHIEACLSSALRSLQGIGGEVVLADSCSSDATVALARRYPVRIVQLASKGLQVHAIQHICVLGSRVLGHAHTLRTQDAVDITDVHRRVHAIERLIHVVHLRRGLRQLQLRLCQRYALRG